ncbi:hypothetical protein HQ571_04715, partial [Candidatus Kuenenbacteria bacterium]|nr:hypothetical protein [Candidatus Kuenenbacteria bacterium]
SDEPLADFVRSLGYQVYQHTGDINDVVGRVLAAAKMVNADIVAGICGDCPFTDPKFVDYVINGMIQNKADCHRLRPEVECMHEGLDACSISALEKQYNNGTEPHYREHLNSYLKENQEKYSWFDIEPEPPFNKKHFRISVDTPSDLKFVRKIHEYFAGQNEVIDLESIIQLYYDNESLRQINNNVTQKSLTDTSLKLVIRTEASEEIGLGHLKRMISLAKVLQNEFFCGLTFVINENNFSQQILQENSLNFITVQSEKQFHAWLQENKNDAVIVDTRSNPEIDNLKSCTVKVIVIDRIDDEVQNADLYIIPSGHSDVPKKDNIISGAEYAIIRDEILKQKPTESERKHILLFGGAGDHNQITENVIKILANCVLKEKVGVFVGSINSRRKDIIELIERYNDKFFVFDPEVDFAEALAQSKLGILGFGQTVYEALYLNVPVIAIAQQKEKFNQDFLDSGLVKVFDPVESLDKEDFLSHFRELSLTLFEKQESSKQKNYIDGKGAKKIAEQIINQIKYDINN